MDRIQLCFDAIERHHELRSQWDRGAEVELIRRADLVDLSDGLIRFGLSREWIRDLFRSVSRDGTYRTIGYEVARVHPPPAPDASADLQALTARCSGRSGA